MFGLQKNFPQLDAHVHVTLMSVFDVIPSYSMIKSITCRLRADFLVVKVNMNTIFLSVEFIKKLENQGY